MYVGGVFFLQCPNFLKILIFSVWHNEQRGMKACKLDTYRFCSHGISKSASYHLQGFVVTESPRVHATNYTRFCSHGISKSASYHLQGFVVTESPRVQATTYKVL